MWAIFSLFLRLFNCISPEKFPGRELRHVTPASKNWLIEPTFTAFSVQNEMVDEQRFFILLFPSTKNRKKNEENTQRRRPTGHTKMRKATKIQ
jgi:hypothetical protein